MARAWALLMALATGGAALGQESKESPTHSEAVAQMIALLEGISKTLEGVTSQETADAAKPELRKLGQEWTALRTKVNKLPPPSREEKADLEKAFKSKLEGARRKLFGEILRVRVVPGGPEALQEIRGVLERKSK